MSELIVIPKEVLFAQAELMSAGMVELGDVLGINVPDRERARKLILSSWAELIEVTPEYSRGARSRISPNTEGNADVQSQLYVEFLERGINVKLSKCSLWLLGLISCSGLAPVLFGLEIAQSLITAYGLLGFLFGSPTISELPEMVRIIDEEDFPYARMAVRLSCGNPYGLCLNSEVITPGKLAEELRNAGRLDGDGDDFLSCARRFSLEVEKSNAKHMKEVTKEGRLSELVAKCLAPLRLFFTYSKDVDVPDVKNDVVHLGNCARALRHLEESRVFVRAKTDSGEEGFRYNTLRERGE